MRPISYSDEYAAMLEIRDLQPAEKVMGRTVEDKNKKKLDIIKRNLSEEFIGDADVKKREKKPVRNFRLNRKKNEERIV